jgi:hypothetical protein
MTEAISAIQSSLKKDPVLRRWSTSIVEELATDEADSDRAELASATLWISLAGVLLLVAKAGIGYLRGLGELDLARRQEDLVQDLVNSGISQELARRCVTSTLKSIRSRPQGDEVIEQLISLVRIVRGGK